MFLRHFHGFFAILGSIVGVKIAPIGHQTWLAIVKQGTKVNAIVPVSGEILDVTILW